MKKFILQNWYKMILGSSMLMASFGFMMYAINPSFASTKENIEKPVLIPVNNDGSISIKLNEEQLNKLKPVPIQKVVISGWTWKHNTSNIYGVGDEPLPVKMKK